MSKYNVREHHNQEVPPLNVEILLSLETAQTCRCGEVDDVCPVSQAVERIPLCAEEYCQ